MTTQERIAMLNERIRSKLGYVHMTTNQLRSCPDLRNAVAREIRDIRRYIAYLRD